MGTAYNGNGVMGVTLWAKNNIFYSQRNGELGLQNYSIICGGKLNLNFVNLYIYIYRVFRNLWKLLQEVIS